MDASFGDAADDVFENAYLLDRLQDLLDDDFLLFIKRGRSLKRENEYLREALAWERAPIRYVYECLPGRPAIADARTASDEEISRALFDLVRRLREINHVILYADHLSDRRLYRLIVRNVLSQELKYLPDAKSPVYWNFCYFTEEEDDEVLEDDREWNWLTYYATDAQRRAWLLRSGEGLPPKLSAPHRREYLAERVCFH